MNLIEKAEWIKKRGLPWLNFYEEISEETIRRFLDITDKDYFNYVLKERFFNRKNTIK